MSRWAQQLEAEGLHGLKKAGRAGRRPRLSAEDLKKIECGLKRGPEALGYETGLWTAWRVAHLIEEECGVRYHTSQGLAHSAATGLELPASGRTGSGAGFGQLSHHARQALRRMRKRPTLVIAFWQQADRFPM